MNISCTLIIASMTASLAMTAPASAADAYWLDEVYAFYYLASFQLDNQLNAIKAKGAKTLLLHSDDLPNPLLRYIVWRAKEAAGLKTILWIQWPTKSNLFRVASVDGAHAVQIDDHYFDDPPVSLLGLKKLLADKELWCSFQPNQWNFSLARVCDHSDVQLYRQSCENTIYNASKLGILGQSKVAISTYHSGDIKDDKLVSCISENATPYGNPVFVFKWANNEAIIKRLFALIPRQTNF